MTALTKIDLLTMIEASGDTFVSIYLPTHRHLPANQQDPIRYRNLIRSAEESLRQRFAARQLHPWFDRFRALLDDSTFWETTLDGLAVLGSPQEFRVYQLQRPVPELAIVADTYHVKPLLRYVQSADRFQVLSLDRESVSMFEGNRYALDPLEMGDFPATLTEALGEEVTEPHLTVASYGKGAAGPAMHHGHGSKKDEVRKDTERFFRVVDREVLLRFSKRSGLPLVLAALPEQGSFFRSLSHNSQLLAAGVDTHPDALDKDELRGAVWKAVEPQYTRRLAKFSDDFGAAAAHNKGTAELPEVGRAAIEGRVAVLLVEDERKEPGRLDTATGSISLEAAASETAEDLLDDVSEAVIRTGGEVVVVPAERMPSGTGVAAIFRY